MGASVLFEGKKKSIQNIYDHAQTNENFAYLKVVNIETVFPNKFVIHIAEREELFAVEHSGQAYVCDREFRVLRKIDDVSTFESTQENPILLKGIEIKNQTISVGDFLDIEQEAIKKFYSVMLQNNRDFSQQIGKFKEVQMGTYVDEITSKEYVSMTMTTFQNRKLIINNLDFAFANKVQKLFAVESAIYNQNVNQQGEILNSKGEVIYVVENDSGEYLTFNPQLHEESEKIALTYAILQNCAIKVDNLTLTDLVHRTENDIYYCFVKIV